VCIRDPPWACDGPPLRSPPLAMGRNEQPPVVLDAAGRISAADDLDGTTADALATAVCATVTELLGREASVVSCSAMGQGTRAFAMAMLRDHTDGGFLSGTASAEGHADAVVSAVLKALGLDGGILAPVAARWKAANDVRAVSVIEQDLETPEVDGDDVSTHLRLVKAMPAPGRLAVETEDTAYRVLRFPAMAMVISTEPSAPTLGEIDAWMAKAEAFGP